MVSTAWIGSLVFSCEGFDTEQDAVESVPFDQNPKELAYRVVDDGRPIGCSEGCCSAADS